MDFFAIFDDLEHPLVKMIVHAAGCDFDIVAYI